MQHGVPPGVPAAVRAPQVQGTVLQALRAVHEGVRVGVRALQVPSALRLRESLPIHVYAKPH